MSPGKPKGRKNNNSPDGLQQLDITGASPADNNFPVVALGASAGGLEAFTQFLTALTHESGIAYVLVQHLESKKRQTQFGLHELKGQSSPAHTPTPHPP